MKSFVVILLTIVAVRMSTAQVSPVESQASASRQPQSAELARVGLCLVSDEPHGLFGYPGRKDDPGYKSYKSGYDLILDEQWEQARKRFAEMVKQFPQSEYVDDAEYWSAYALEHQDKDTKKAYKAYKEFIVNYPNSNYYDDAVAEMFKLGGGNIGIGKSGSTTGVREGAMAVSVDKHGVVLQEPDGKGSYRYRYESLTSAPRVRGLERTLNQMHHQLGRIRMPAVGMPVPVPEATLSGAPSVLAPGVWSTDEKLDPETRLKMDALYALGDTKEDSMSFATLHDVVVDPKQPRPLRQAAMDVLSEFKKYDVLKVFLEVAKRDTSEMVQNMAIDYIGQSSSDKDKSVAALIDLFSAIPSYRPEKLQTVLWSIGEIGNRRAVGFLAKVARTHENYTLRTEAVQYLGSIGGNEARQALYEILKSK